MTTSKEITATEKLLELIRASSTGTGATAPPAAPDRPAEVVAPAVPAIFPATVSSTVSSPPEAIPPAEPIPQPEPSSSPSLELSLESAAPVAEAVAEVSAPTEPIPQPQPSPAPPLELSLESSTPVAEAVAEVPEPAPELILTLEEIAWDHAGEEAPRHPVEEAPAEPLPPPPSVLPEVEPHEPSPLDLAVAEQPAPVESVTEVAEVGMAPESVPPVDAASAAVLLAAPEASAEVADEATDEDDDFLAEPKAEPQEEAIAVGGIVLPPPRKSLWRAAVDAVRQGAARLQPQAKIIVAIDIQPGMIQLVKTLNSKQGHELLDYRSVPYDVGSEGDAERLYTYQPFRETLFRALSEFVSGHGQHEYWCSFAYCHPIRLANITVPKVDEAMVASAVFWAAKRELEFDDEDELFDFTILQEISDGAQAKLQALVSLVPKAEVRGVEAIFKDAGFPLSGLSFPAAAIQNFLSQDITIPVDEPVVYFTIRNSNSFIDLFYQGKMFFSREIKTGVDSFVESLVDHAMGQNIVLDEERAKAYLFRAYATPDLAEDEFLPAMNFEALKVVDRLARQLTRTFEYCGTTFKLPTVTRIVTSGAHAFSDRVLKAIENRVGIRCEVIEPGTSPVFHRKNEMLPANTANFLVATGLSLSDRQRTANFLFTHADRQREAATNRVNSIIAVSTICLALGCGLFIAWNYKQQSGQEATIAAMRLELDRKYQLEPRSRTSDYASQTIQKIGQFHKDNRQKLQRYQVVAMVGELARSMDKDIHLTDMVLDMEAKAGAAKEQQAPPRALLVVNGYVGAAPENQEFLLMNLLKAFAQGNLLVEPELKMQEKTFLGSQEVLRFELHLKSNPGFLEPVSP